MPTEPALDSDRIELEVFRDHLVVIGAKWRDPRIICQPHAEKSRMLRERCDRRSALCMGDHVRKHIPERLYIVRADVKCIRAVVLKSLDARIREVLGINELIPVAASANDPNLTSLVD